MSCDIDTAMIMAAGQGTRMRPLTNDIPKALVKVNGKAMVDHAIDRVKDAGISRIVFNIHAHADKMRAHLEARNDDSIIISDETDALLETGGGIKKALPLLGDKPILTHNCDSIWVEGMGATLPRLIDAFDPAEMDAMLVLAVTASIVGDVGRGDFTMEADGRIEWREPRSVAPFMYTGVQIIKPQLFADIDEQAFSTTKVWRTLTEQGRAYGLRHDGIWMHVGTPQALDDTEAFLRDL
ncbi:nucleotidyltransferase family protein [Pyruvatibacter mobilis]|uniref:nucleotidyltransferase family protein n=1 Tax=Pyruvatibacter mobilis TaxID=1712261 RepID=UPI003BA88482